MRILVVEDDELIARGIAASLQAHGMTVDTVATASRAAAALAAAHADAMVLDLGLPDEDGMTLLRRLRDNGSRLPVLVLTARDAVEDRIAGLHSGADDYLAKPFDVGELVARLRAISRRAAGRATDRLEGDGIALDPTTGLAESPSGRVALSRRESDLLAALLEARGRCLTAAQLEERLYGFGAEVGSNAVNVHVHNIRRKLGADSIETVRGFGYRAGRARQ
jgi:two-component system, OmpR family, response regulator QseB